MGCLTAWMWASSPTPSLAKSSSTASETRAPGSRGRYTSAPPTLLSTQLVVGALGEWDYVRRRDSVVAWPKDWSHGLLWETTQWYFILFTQLLGISRDDARSELKCKNPSAYLCGHPQRQMINPDSYYSLSMEPALSCAILKTGPYSELLVVHFLFSMTNYFAG